MIKTAWRSTLSEKVYMAKLAVFISAPSRRIMHWPVSGRGEDALLSAWAMEVSLSVDRDGLSKLALQGVDLSDKSTPRSRASCSNVMGMKDPVQGGRLALHEITQARWSSNTNAADYKHLRCPAITVPTIQLLPACEPCIFPRILRDRPGH